jgi:hypothetical protein
MSFYVFVFLILHFKFFFDKKKLKNNNSLKDPINWIFYQQTLKKLQFLYFIDKVKKAAETSSQKLYFCLAVSVLYFCPAVSVPYRFFKKKQ